jgi:hypothetical protein
LASGLSLFLFKNKHFNLINPQKNTMGWKEYYQTYPESFCGQFGYELLSKIFNSQDRFFLNKKENLKLALGGFSPNSPTAATFINYCAELRPNQEDEIYLLDLNRRPFETAYLPPVPSQKNLYRVQADLTKMPFARNSLDLIFLDGTTMFMKSKEVGHFGREANRALSRFGLLVNFLKTPFVDQIAPISNLRGRRVNKVPIFFRSKQENQKLLDSLKTLVCFDCRGKTALIMARKDSPLPQDPEHTYALEPAYPKFSKKIS